MQRAEPVLVAHWLLAYVEMVLRDAARLRDCAARLNYCPLGSGAVAGATLALDRNLVARELGFSAPTANSMDATSDRDFILEYLQALTFVGLHLSRFAEEITLFATAEFGFVTLPEAFSTGSSAMPQKKNPDLTELIRAKVGRIHGAAEAVTLQLKGLPLAYNKDMQETQEPAFSVEFVPQMLRLVARFTARASIQSRAHERGCAVGLPECHGRGHLSRAQGRSFPHRAREDRQCRALCASKRASNSASSPSTNSVSLAGSSKRIFRGRHA